MFVDVQALNLRSAPDSAADNRVGTLFLMQKVSVIAEPAAGWAEVEAMAGGQARRGFVAARFLRPPLSPNREALVASVGREFMRFEQGRGKENDAPFAGFVGEMWRAIGVDNLDGTDRDVPWSAAAISLMVRNAGPAYRAFGSPRRIRSSPTTRSWPACGRTAPRRSGASGRTRCARRSATSSCATTRPSRPR
jgi:hypothetical protein